MNQTKKYYLNPLLYQRWVFILFISKQYNFLLKDKNTQILHVLKYKIEVLPKLPVVILKIILPYLYLNASSVRNIFLNYSHRELRYLLSLGNSPRINKQLTKFKEYSSQVGSLGITSLGFFVFLAFKNKKSEILSEYLDLLFFRTSFNATPTHPADTIRYELLEIIPTHVQEVQTGLNLISDKKLRKFKPSNYETLITILTNSLADVGRLFLDGGANIKVPKFSNLIDLAYKYNRLWLLENGKNEVIIQPYWMTYLHNKELNELKISLAFTTKEIYHWAVVLENCAHSLVTNAVHQKVFLFTLKEKAKVKYLVQINEDGTIMEIKGKYNEVMNPEEQFKIQNFIYKTLKEIT